MKVLTSGIGMGLRRFGIHFVFLTSVGAGGYLHSYIKPGDYFVPKATAFFTRMGSAVMVPE